MTPPDIDAEVTLPRPYDLRRSLLALRLCPGDLGFRSGIDGVWRATRTPDGPATLHASTTEGSDRVAVAVWGEGSGWVHARVAAWLGAMDDPAGFDPAPGVVREMHRRHPGLHFARTGLVLEALVPTVLGQKVTTEEASRSYRAMSRAWGDPAPGPAHLQLPPDPDRIADAGYADFHPFGIERRRAETLRRVAGRRIRLDALAQEPAVEARRVLEVFPGVGPWTSNTVTSVSHGDADAVIVGDFHLPRLVAAALADEPRADDERMLDLLAPYAGQRGRVVRLVQLSGRKPPRRSPKQPLRHLTRR